MFRNKPLPPFRECDNKRVITTTAVYKEGQSGEIEILPLIPRSHRTNTKIVSGFGATLDCPRTQDENLIIESDYSNHTSKIAAVDSLERIAGELICRDCQYSSMTPVEVSMARADYATAEARRLEAYATLESAKRELEDSTSHIEEHGT